MEKTCSKCKKILSLKKFYRDKQKKDGLKSYCKSCDAIIGYRNGKPFYNQRKLNRRALNRESMNDSYWKQLAIRHKLDFLYVKSLYESQNKLCFYCKFSINGSNLQLDHYYPQSNEKHVLTCSDCNRLKWNRNGDEFIIFISSYIKRFS